MGLFDRRRRADLPTEVRVAVPLRSGDRVIAWAKDEQSGGHVVASTQARLRRPGRVIVWQRRPHEAESGTWQSDSGLLTVIWVDHRRPAQWLIREPSMLQQALRERIQASVVLSDEFRTESRRTVEVVIRQDFATGELLEQVIPGKGAARTTLRSPPRQLAGSRASLRSRPLTGPTGGP